MEVLITSEQSNTQFALQQKNKADQAFKNCKDQLKSLQNCCFQLGMSLDLLPNIREASIRISKFNQAKATYNELKQSGDLFFREGDSNFLLESEPDLMCSNLKLGNDLVTRDDGLEILETLSEKLPKSEIQNMNLLLTYPNAIKSFSKWLQVHLKEFLPAERTFLRNLKRCEKTKEASSFFEDKFVEAFVDYSKVRALEMQASIEEISQLLKFLESSIQEQSAILESVSLKIPIIKDQSKKQKLNRQSLKSYSSHYEKTQFLNQLMKGNFVLTRKLLQNFVVNADDKGSRNFGNLIEGDEVLYLRSRNFVHVFNKSLMPITFFDLKESELQHCLEIDKKYLLCSGGQKLYKYSLNDYVQLIQIETSIQVQHILQWEKGLVVLTSSTGELVLFDHYLFKIVSKIKLCKSRLRQSIKCQSDDVTLLIACGDEGVFVTKLENQTFEIEESYFKMKQISRILEFNESIYSACFYEPNRTLIGLIDRKINSSTEIKNPIFEEETLTIDKVKGLEEIALIQTSHNMFLLNCATLSLTHVISIHFDFQNIVIKYESLRKCLQIIRIFSQEDKQDSNKINKQIYELLVKLR